MKNMHPVRSYGQGYDLTLLKGTLFGGTDREILLAETGVYILFRAHIADHLHPCLYDLSSTLTDYDVLWTDAHLHSPFLKIEMKPFEVQRKASPLEMRATILMEEPSPI